MNNNGLISRQTAIDKLFEYAESKFQSGEIELANGILKAKCFLESPCNIPTAYDVDKVLEQCENVAERYADCDEFVCSKCGIHLMEWAKVSIDEDYDDEIHSEYVFRYCPNCGAKIKAGD